MALVSSLTARESVDFWKRFVGEGPSVGTLVRLSAEAGRCLEECSTEVMDELRKQEELPENASLIQVGLDGAMMRMNAEKNGDEVTEEGLIRRCYGEANHLKGAPGTSRGRDAPHASRDTRTELLTHLACLG